MLIASHPIGTSLIFNESDIQNKDTGNTMVDGPIAKRSRRWSLLSRSAEPSPEPERPKSFNQLPARSNREVPDQLPPPPKTRTTVLSKHSPTGLPGRKGMLVQPGVGMAPLKEEEEHGERDVGKAFFHLNGLRYLKSTRKQRSSSDVGPSGEERVSTQHNSGAESPLFPNAERRLEQEMAYPATIMQPAPLDSAGLPRRSVVEPSAWSATSAALSARASTIPMTSPPAAINSRRWSETPFSRPQSVVGPVMSATIPSHGTSRVSNVSASGTLFNPIHTLPAGVRNDADIIPSQSRVLDRPSVPIAATITRQQASQNPVSTPSMTTGIVSDGTGSAFPQEQVSTETAPATSTTAGPSGQEPRRRSDPGSSTTSSHLVSSGVPQPNTRQSQQRHASWAEISQEFFHGKRQASETLNERTSEAREPDAPADSRTAEILEAIRREQERDDKIRDAISNDPLGISDHGVVSFAASISSSSTHTRSSSNGSKATLLPTPSIIRSNRVMEELAKLHAQEQDEQLSEMEGFPGLSANTEMPRPEAVMSKPAELGPGTPRPLDQIAELHSDHIPDVRIGEDVVHPSLIPGRHNNRRAATDVRYKDIPTDMATPPMSSKRPLTTDMFETPRSSDSDLERVAINNSASTYRGPVTTRRQSVPASRPNRARLPPRSSTDYGHDGTRLRSSTILTPPSVRVIPPTPPSSASSSPVWNEKGASPTIMTTFERLDQLDAAGVVISEVVTPPEPLTSSESKTEPQIDIVSSTPEPSPQVYIPPPPPPPPVPPATPSSPGTPCSSVSPTPVTPQEQFNPNIAPVTSMTEITTPPATPPEARPPPPPLPPKPLPYKQPHALVAPTTVLNTPTPVESSKARARGISLVSSKHSIARPPTPETDNQPLLACLGDDYAAIHYGTPSAAVTRPTTTESNKQPAPGRIDEDSQPKPRDQPTPWIPPNPYAPPNPQGEGAEAALARVVSRRTKLKDALERVNAVDTDPQLAVSGSVNVSPRRVNTIPRKPVPVNTRTAGRRFTNDVPPREAWGPGKDFTVP
ncbi:hypothetical protein K440DRAFT_663942 [Wilcoxina mikolae CBS 423.85]|nr:hypothetical protein K440DRAFT_663942 [Wilcoxina mikolae CBS 423.85]